MRNLLIAGLAAMSLIAFGACGGDEEEPSTKECTSNADCTDASKPVCDNGTCVADSTVTEGCVTNADCTDPALPICDNGTCVADSTVSEGCATNDDCADPALPICDNGTCVAAPASNCPDGQYEIDGTCYAEGDACDSQNETLFMGGCIGNTAVYCSYGAIVVNACDEGMACGIDEDVGATCFKACDEVNEVISECVTSVDGVNAQVDYLCVALTNGSLGAMYIGGQECSAGCDAETNKCVKLVEDEGEACDATFVERCDGDIVVYCQDGEVVAGDCGGEATATACGYSAEDNYADCVVPSSCEQETADAFECVTGADREIYSLKTVCVSASDNTYGEIEIASACAHGCDSETQECIKLVDNEGEKCSTTGENAFVESCGGADGNVIVYCGDGVVTAYDCGLNSCLTLKDGNWANCFTEESSCEEGDEMEKSCYYNYSEEYTCAEMSDGQYHYYLTAETECLTSQYCSNESGKCEDLPAGWNAEACTILGATAYGDGYCDCGCGAKDIDCEDGNSSSCDFDYCEEGEVNATQNWICE